MLRVLLVVQWALSRSFWASTTWSAVLKWFGLSSGRRLWIVDGSRWTTVLHLWTNKTFENTEHGHTHSSQWLIPLKILPFKNTKLKDCLELVINGLSLTFCDVLSNCEEYLRNLDKNKPYKKLIGWARGKGHWGSCSTLFFLTMGIHTGEKLPVCLTAAAALWYVHLASRQGGGGRGPLEGHPNLQLELDQK